MIPTAEVVAYRRASDSGVGESASPRRKSADRAFASCLQANQTAAATAHALQDAASLVRAGAESARQIQLVVSLERLQVNLTCGALSWLLQSLQPKRPAPVARI